MIKEESSTILNTETKEEKFQYTNILRVKNESGTEDVYYPLFYEDLPDEFAKVLEETVGETANSKENGLKSLKEYMEKEKLSATDDLLIAVLRVCKYNLKKSNTKLKSFLRSLNQIIKKLRGLDEEKINLILRDALFTMLPYRDKDGRAIMVSRPTFNLDLYSVEDVEPVIWSLILYVLTFPLTATCGVTYLAECKCDSIMVFYHLIKPFRFHVYNLIDFPLRLRRVDIVNENFLVRLGYNTVRPLLPTKVKKRVFFHGHSYESLNKIFPPDILPQDMDGKLGPLSNEFLKERLLKFMQTLREETLQDCP